MKYRVDCTDNDVLLCQSQWFDTLDEAIAWGKAIKADFNVRNEEGFNEFKYIAATKLSFDCDVCTARGGCRSMTAKQQIENLEKQIKRAADEIYNEASQRIKDNHASGSVDGDDYYRGMQTGASSVMVRLREIQLAELNSGVKLCKQKKVAKSS